jgi:hypothetical protein
MPYHDDLAPTLKDLADAAIDECVRSKKANDFQFPILLLSGPTEKSITVLVNDSENATEVAIATARERVRTKAEALDAYAIAYDGLLKAKDGSDLEAFIVECGEKGQAEAFVFFQRYRRAEDGELVLVFGASSFLRRTEQLLK